jgi:hypothetical protein
MSDHGVILFHDIDVRDRETFGVWRFWDETKRRYPHFEFYHSYGLGVLAVGESIPEGLKPLIGTTGIEAARIREYFRNLGDHLEEFFNISLQKGHLQEQLHAVQGQLHDTQGQLCAAQAQLHDTQGHLHDTQAQLRDTQARLHDTQAGLRDTQARLHDTQGQLLGAEARLHDTQGQLHARVEECIRLGEELTSLRDELCSTREYFSHFRFRAVNKVAIRLARLPRVYRLLRHTAHVAAAASRSMMRGRRPGAAVAVLRSEED